jgi:ribosomal protein S14
MFSIFKSDDLNQRNRLIFLNSEIFFDCCLLLDQSKFSNNLNYLFFKGRQTFIYNTKIKNSCVFSGYKRSVFSRFKLSKQKFSHKILTGSMIGFYKAT